MANFELVIGGWSLVIQHYMSIPQTSDSIEFHCTGCGRALKVPASAAGRRASCPQCNAVVQVPLVPEPQTPATTIPPAEGRVPGGDGRSSGTPAPPRSGAASATAVTWAMAPEPPPAAPPPPP